MISSTEADDDAPQFNKPAVVVRHVLMKTLKWAAIGAAVGAVALIAAGALGTVAGGLPVWITGAVAHFFKIGGGASHWLEVGLETGLKWGAVAGAVGGAVAGITTAHEAIENEGERLQAKQDNFRMRRESNALLAHQRDLQAVELQRQAQTLGFNNPNMALSMGGGGTEPERGR